MKIVRSLTLCFIMAGTASFLFAQMEWSIDKSHARIGFAVTHMGISETEGKFNEFDGKVITKGDKFDGATVEFTAKTASVDTDNERRDNHLRSDDFFNAEAFPELKFMGKIAKENDQLVLNGDLTIRDVTKPVQFNVTHKGTIEGRRGPKAGFKIAGTINRFDYNLKFDRAMPGGDLVVGKNVDIICNVEIDGVIEPSTEE